MARTSNSGKTLKHLVLSLGGDTEMAPGKTWRYRHKLSDITIGNPEPSFSLRRRCIDCKASGIVIYLKRQSRPARKGVCRRSHCGTTH